MPDTVTPLLHDGQPAGGHNSQLVFNTELGRASERSAPDILATCAVRAQHCCPAREAGAASTSCTTHVNDMARPAAMVSHDCGVETRGVLTPGAALLPRARVTR